MGHDTIAGAVHLDDEAHRSTLRWRRIGYTATMVVLAAIMLGAVADGLGVDVYGVDSAHVRATGSGWELDVRYGTVSRPALATPFDIEVTHPGGFDGPVIVAVSSEYLAMWDENGLDPAPDSETADGEQTIWTFEPPDGEVLSISFDGRIEPGAQSGERGHVAVRDEAGTELVAVDFTTRVLP